MKKIVAIVLALVLMLSFTCVSAMAEGEDKIVIRLGQPDDGLTPSFLKALEMTDFYQKYPNVVIEPVFIADSADYNQKLITMAMSGSDDIDMLWVASASTGVLANGGVLRNLDDFYANETRFDIHDDEKFIADAVDTFIKANGSYYAYPYQTDCRIAFWYKPVCEACGYTKDNYPATTEEFITFCQKVSEAGYCPLAIQYATDWTIDYEWALSLYGSGGTFEKWNEETGKWEANLDNEIGRKWISDVREISKTIPGDTLTTMAWDQMCASFSTGNVASTFIGTWMWTDCLGRNAEEAEKYDTTLIPAGSEYSGSSMGGWLLGIFNNASDEHAAIVWDMIEAISNNPEANAVATSNAMPYLRGAYDHFEWAGYDWSKEGWENFQTQIATAQPICTPPCEAAAAIYSAMWTIWQECTMTDKYSVEEATTMLNERIQSAIDDYYGY